MKTNVFYIHGKPLPTAQDARSFSARRLATDQRTAVYQIKDRLDAAIERAISTGQNSAEITAPPSADESTLNGLKAALKKLGYGVTLAYKNGFYIEEEGSLRLVREPSYTVKVRW